MKTTYPPLDYWVKVWPFIFRCIVVILLLLGCAGQGLTAGPNDTKPWRSGWMAPWKSDLSEEEKDDAILSAAKDLNFQALIINGTPERVQEFSIKAREFGIDIYSCLRPKSPEGGDKSQFEQSMPLSDVELLNKLKSNPQEWKNTYQFGGEPLEGHEEVSKGPVLCFHRKEVMEATKKAIRELLENAPGVAGVGFDGFGYQNYKNCVCEESLRQLEAYRKQHPAMSPEESESDFALDSLVGCINELADFARSLRPEIKTTIHIWPTYLPQPLYGNRLDLDYCCQTVAWFFPPYWSESKIAAYTKTVVRDENKYFPRARGIPFVGVYLNKKSCEDKPLQQFRKELSAIFSNDPSASISIHEIADVLLNTEYRNALREALQMAGASSIPSKETR